MYKQGIPIFKAGLKNLRNCNIGITVERNKWITNQIPLAGLHGDGGVSHDVAFDGGG